MESSLHPFLILGLGVAIVIGMIIGLRLNAFVALITAALTVSLLAPGAVADKVARVATAFGNTAGGIAIVIAMAAIIGDCLMKSGAADRIVKAFLKVLGEKRSPIALAASGFVLAIPVFFDTVFYLLVPLARSLYRSTKKNYLLYILAISAGGAVTHTLVPPTPGPLLMAQQLGVDLGIMIGIGCLIGLPASIAALTFAAFLNRCAPLEMRALPGEDSTETSEVASARPLPGLLVSLLPILLPVVLIGLSTALETRANAERAAQVRVPDLKDFDGLYAAAKTATEGPMAVVKSYLPEEGASPGEVVAALNAALAHRTAFATGANLSRANLAMVERENRLVLEKVLPDTILARHVWETPKRKASDLGQLYGNANFALLLSAVIAVLLYVRQCRPGKKEFAEVIETSLMSGGLIILITSAGGAFGAMLAAAKIGPAIEAIFPSSAGGGGGLVLLFLGFGIAALLKFAQGSTTVAVITASGMIAAMADVMQLGFHPVYLATAIGGGGLVGAWMNDSGFWIVAKMSGLTELEALKSWTPMLVVIGVTTLVMSVILSIVMPLV